MKRKSRIYWRDQGGERRAYIDLRDLGGGREALKVPGEKRATTDPDLATELAADRVKKLEKKKRRKVLHGLEESATLKEFAAYHLEEKAKSGSVTSGWLENSEFRLSRAVEYFGPDRDVDSITAADTDQWAKHLGNLPNGRGGTLSGGTVRHYLNALSNLYRRAVSEGCATSNPVADMLEKPSANTDEASWLEIHDAALFLESARTFRPERPEMANDGIHAIVATFLLTGGRKSEVLGLSVDDVSFSRNTITFRPNEHRRLKTKTAHRSVPLWPQLREILRDHLFGREEASDGLLFPSSRSGGQIRDLRKALDAIGQRVGWAEGEIRTKMFRHTYTAARLQTLDNGAPVSPWTVSKEMGHGGRSLVDRVYGHLGEVRHRSEVVEYRVEQHAEELGDRLDALRKVG